MIFTLKNLALALILLGVLFLAAQHFLHFTFVNALLLVPLFLIVAGIVIFVWGQKRESKY